jgi:hypothetical protein
MTEEKPAKKQIISEEVATEQMQMFYDYYDMAIEEASERQSEVLQLINKRLIKAIRNGRLTIDNKNGLEVIQTLQTGKQLKYKVISGEAKQAMKASAEQDHLRNCQLIGYLTGKGSGGIGKLEGIDMSVSECLGALFLHV